VSLIDELLDSMCDDDKEAYIVALREVVKSPGVGGAGEYIGSLVPLVFASDEEKFEALKKLNKWTNRE
jgi:hypothetical protein